jgi:transcriptional regulator with XRE-family HTH domain
MVGKERIIEKIISEIDWFIIERVRDLRKTKFSQAALSREIGFSEGFIGKIENPNQSAVYSFRHINLIAKALKVSIEDLLPKKPLSSDLIRIVIKLGEPTKTRTGETNYEIIKKTSLTESEIRKYNNATLNRPSKSGELPKSKKRRPKK